MILKREVTVNGVGLGLALSKRVACSERFTNPFAAPVKIQHIRRSAPGCTVTGAPPGRLKTGADFWEAFGYVALWGSGLLGIGLCFL